MPIATLSIEPEQHALKSLPGAWVKLRRMTYGERLHRSDIAMTMSMQQENRRNQVGGKLEIKQAQTSVGEFEFATCVVEHNLEKDEAGTAFNFRNGVDFQLLDGRVGEEIAALIEQMHNWEADLPNFGEKSTPSSSAREDPMPQGQVLTPWRAN
jgi:hypothetical protein